LSFCVHTFLFVDGKSHSVSDTLYGVFPFWVPTFLLYIWIADRTSRHREAPGNQIQIVDHKGEGRIANSKGSSLRPPRNSGKRTRRGIESSGQAFSPRIKW